MPSNTIMLTLVTSTDCVDVVFRMHAVTRRICSRRWMQLHLKRTRRTLGCVMLTIAYRVVDEVDAQRRWSTRDEHIHRPRRLPTERLPSVKFDRTRSMQHNTYLLIVLIGISYSYNKQTRGILHGPLQQTVTWVIALSVTTNSW